MNPSTATLTISESTGTDMMTCMVTAYSGVTVTVNWYRVSKFK